MDTGVDRNFDWGEGAKWKTLLTLFSWHFWWRYNDDVTEMTSYLIF